MLLSGINKGANLGVETLFSGTVGAAMTGLLMGVPSIALSQYFTRRDSVRWDTARTLAPGVIRQLLGKGWEQSACLNINFPDVPASEAGPVQITRQGAGRMDGVNVNERTDFREANYYWLNITRHQHPEASDTETQVVTQGGISVTPLEFDRTAIALREQLQVAVQTL